MRITDAERIINEHISELYDKPCSLVYHLNRKGGLMIHLNNVMMIAKEYFPNDETVIALALIHDIGKAREYMWDSEGMRRVNGSKEHTLHTIDMISESGYELIPDELTAIKFHHGGFSDIKPIEMNELAIKLHFCDHLSTVREQ